MAIGLPLRKYLDEDGELDIYPDSPRIKKPVNKNLKMYILILDWVDIGHAINSVGHASLMGYLEWEHDPIIKEWLANSFKKATCKVNTDEFERAMKFDDFVVVTELAFDGREVGLVFKPRYEWPKFFKYLKLYK